MVNPRRIIMFWIRQFSKAFYTTEHSCWFLDQCLCGCQFSQFKIKALQHVVCFRILYSIYCLDVQSLLFYGAAVVFSNGRTLQTLIFVSKQVFAGLCVMEEYGLCRISMKLHELFCN